MLCAGHDMICNIYEGDKLKKPNLHSKLICCLCALAPLYSWALDHSVDASIDRDAIPLHSTSLYIPVPSDSLEDPDTMGHLVPQLFDDCLG